ncbi:MAG: putative metalloprotease CJM1_0395 family protein [Planctomycetota bacterium]
MDQADLNDVSIAFSPFAGFLAPQPLRTESARPGQTQTSSSTADTQSTPAARGVDQVFLSPQAQASSKPRSAADPKKPSSSDLDTKSKGSAEELTDEEKQQVEELKARDAEVRAHEQAHVAAAGSLHRGGPTYSYQTGPDGKKYAVGGSVQIDSSPGKTPEETLMKAQRIRAAALAPAEPSSTDRSVAAKATRMEAEAKREIAEKQEADQEDSTETASTGPVRTNNANEAPVAALAIDTYA